MNDIVSKDQYDSEYNSFGINTSGLTPLTTGVSSVSGSVPNIISEPIDPSSIQSGQIGSQVNMVNGFMQSSNFESGKVGWQIKYDGSAEFQNVNIGTKILTIDPTQSIQTALDTINSSGGGILNLKEGTYTITSPITGYSSVQIVGINKGTTILDFGSTSANLDFSGTNVYTTGTITSITSGVNVTGSGTSWLANVTAGQHLFIGTRWYQIAAVTSNTTLILADAYGDNVTLPSSYRIATPKSNILIERVTLKNSTGSALSMTDCRDIELSDILFLSNNKGLAMTNCAFMTAIRLTSVSSTSHGYDLANGSLLNFQYCAASGNGGNGYNLNNLKSCPFLNCASDANTGDGINGTTLDSIEMAVEVNGNGSNGIEFVSNCNACFIIDSIVNGNASDGIKLTATDDNNTIGSSINIIGNGGYGINIAASTCDNNTLIAPYLANNSSGGINDSGTGTIIINTFLNGFIASDNLILSADTERSTSSTTFVEIKRFTITRTGTVRIKFDIHSDSSFGSHGRVYLNGVAFGPQQNTTSSTYVTFSQDVDVSSGDIVSIYVFTDNGAHPVFIRNARIYADTTSVGDGIVRID